MKDIDEYEAFLTSKLDGWSANQRVAFAAAMVERWLHTYEKFSADEQWDDAANMRRILERIWQQVLGQSLTPVERAPYAVQVDESTPHMDDFDAHEALATCVILSEALDVCGSPDSATAAVRAALSGFEAAVPDWAFDPEEQPRLWRKVAARNELTKQLKLVERIDTLTNFDAAGVTALRKSLSSAEYRGKVSAPAKTSKTPVGLTNQAAFEQYRAMITREITEKPWEPPAGLAFGLAMKFTTPWMSRYSRRQKTLNGSYGKLADVLAQNALVARNRRRDVAGSEKLLWDSDRTQYVELIYRNPVSDLDAKSIDAPHGYGPSLRRLWVEAKTAGRSDQEACASVAAWARHQPTAWAMEDQRKKKGLAHLNPALSDYLAQPLAWSRSDDVNFPWESDVNDSKWRVRLNDFPDEMMYTPVIGADEIGPFRDWPANWQRS